MGVNLRLSLNKFSVSECRGKFAVAADGDAVVGGLDRAVHKVA